MFILTIVSLSMAQMIGLGVLADANSDHLTSATALAANKLEELRNSDFDSITAGGSLASDETGFFESLDVDANGNADYTRRWAVTDQNGGKLLEVVVIASADAFGGQRQATAATVVADR
jgi:hypothetical protein